MAAGAAPSGLDEFLDEAAALAQMVLGGGHETTTR
jgi:hypothetical protein